MHGRQSLQKEFLVQKQLPLRKPLRKKQPKETTQFQGFRQKLPRLKGYMIRRSLIVRASYRFSLNFSRTEAIKKFSRTEAGSFSMYTSNCIGSHVSFFRKQKRWISFISCVLSPFLGNCPYVCPNIFICTHNSLDTHNMH